MKLNLRNHRLKWLRLIFTFIVFSIILLCCSPQPEAFISPDCTIPSSAEVIHYPMMHNISEMFQTHFPQDVQDFFEESIIYSQFQLFKTIQNYNDMDIFWEGFSSSLMQDQRDSIDYVLENKEDEYSYLLSNNDIKKLFKNYSSYDYLTYSQKKILLELGGAPVAFAYGATHALHRVVTPKEALMNNKKILSIYQENLSLKDELIPLRDEFSNKDNNQKLKELEKEIDTIIEQMNQNQKKMDEIIFDQREVALKKEVQAVLKKTNKPVLIAFGAAHDFSDEFKNYEFYTISTQCSLPQSFLSHPYYAITLIHKADRLLENKQLSPKQTENYYKEAYTILNNVLENKESEKYWNSFFDRPYTDSELKYLADVAYKKYKNRPLDDKNLIMALMKYE